MSRPERPVALITGASRGIGAAIARALAPEHRLILCARRAESLEASAAAVIERGGESALLARLGAELSEPAARLQLFAELEALPGIDILINNAGVADSAPLRKTDDATWLRAMEINARAPFELCRALVPAMAKRGWGRVVTIASTAAKKGYAYTAAYSASKGAVVALTRAMAAEFATKGVSINAVCPGFCDTDIVADAVANIVDKTGQDPAKAKDALAGFSPQGRLVQPDEVAAMVAWLCSEAAAPVHGQALGIDGGESV